MRFNGKNIPQYMRNALKWIPLEGKRAYMKEWQNKGNRFETVANTTAQKGNAAAGFIINDTGLAVVDIDRAIDDDGKTSPEVKAVFDKVKELAGKTYAERSISGKGFHIFLKANVPDLPAVFKIPLGGETVAEFYTGNGGAKYFAVTGDKISKTDRDTIAEGTAFFEWAYNWFLEKYPQKKKAAAPDERPKNTQQENGPKDTTQITDIDRLIEAMRNDKKGMDFVLLFDEGDISNYNNDHSAADQALMNKLCWYTNGNEAMMENIFNRSKLADRPKWQNRPKYREMTIKAAIAGWDGKGYDPRDYSKLEKKYNLTEFEKKQLTDFIRTDTGNAQRLQLVSRGNILYTGDFDIKNPWMKWDGKKWRKGSNIMLYNEVSEVLSYTRHIATDESLIKYLYGCTNQNKITACIERSKGIFLKSEYREFDNDPYLLNCQNGVINLKTGELYPHDKKYMCSKITKADFVPELVGQDTLWTETVKSIIPNEKERRYIQKWAGYMLVGEAIEEKLLFIYGPGGTGKGTFINTIQNVMGDYATTADIEIFLSSRNDGHGGGANASPEIAKLAGTRLAVASESELGRKLNASKVKNLTGNDLITTRRLYSMPFDFVPVCKFVLQSNYLPAVRDSADEGMKRRLVIATFNEDFKDRRNITLKQELLKPENKAGVLAWCVEGCRMWLNETLGDMPHSYAQRTTKFYLDSDTLQQFLDEEYQGIEGEFAPVAEVLWYFKEWSNDQRITRRVFMEQMKLKGFVTVTKRDKQYYKDLKKRSFNV